MTNLRLEPARTCWTVLHDGQPWADLEFPLAGEYNVWNATAAAALAASCGIPKEAIAAALKTFKSVKRRLEVKAQVNGITIIDDFAHHPTAIAGTLRALRARYAGARLWAILEPRSNTLRRRVLQTDLARSLALADEVIVAGVFRSEAVPENERLELPALAAEIEQNGRRARLLADADAIVQTVAPEMRSGDVVAILSNGGFGGIYEKLPTRLRELTDRTNDPLVSRQPRCQVRVPHPSFAFFAKEGGDFDSYSVVPLRRTDRRPQSRTPSPSPRPRSILSKFRSSSPPVRAQRDLQLPVWNALYQVRDFAQYVNWVRAKDRSGKQLAVRESGKSRWQIQGAEAGAIVEYQIYVDSPGPFGAQFNEHHAFLQSGADSHVSGRLPQRSHARAFRPGPRRMAHRHSAHASHPMATSKPRITIAWSTPPSNSASSRNPISTKPAPISA